MATITEPAPTSNRAVAVRPNQPLRLRADTAWNWFVRTNEGAWTQFATGTLEAFRTMATSVANRLTFDRVEIAIGSAGTPDTSTTRHFDLCEGPPAVLWATGRMENEALSEPPARPWEGEDDDPPQGTPWTMPPADRTGFGTTLGETVSERDAGPANLFASWSPGVYVDTSGGVGLRTPFTNDARGLGPFPAVAAWYQGGLYFEHDFGKSRNLALTRVLYEESGAPNNVAIVRGDGRRNTYRLSGGTYTGAAGIRNTLTKSGGIFTETTPSGRVYRYSSAGRLERVVDRVGNPVYFSYDVNNRLQRIDGLPGQNSIGLVPYFTYNASGLLEKLQLQDGTTPANTRESYFTYDGNKNLLRIIGPESCITYFEYNPATRLQAVTDPEGFRWYFAYDANGRVERVLDALGKPTYFSWTPASALGAKVDRAGTITYFRWGPFGSPEYVYNRGTSADYFRYDGDGNLIGSRTRLGREWYFQYDSQANRISVADPLNGRAYFAYDAQSLLRTYVDQLGRPTYMTYDGQRNREQWTDAVGGTAYYSYESTGLLRQKKDRRGAITYMQWDSRANVTRVVDPLQNTTYFAYNSANERTALRDPLERVSYFEYDKRGRQTLAIDPVGAPSYWAYDARCNLVLQRDARMSATTYQYDGNSNRTRATDALSNVTYFAYEPEEKPNLLVNARGNPTYMSYDALGRRQRQVDAYGGVTYFGYTTEHLFNLQVDARGNATYFFHDRVGRQTHDKNALMREAYLGYDLAGQRVLSRDRRNFATYLQYDPRGWLRRTETAVGAVTYMAFDAEGNRERMVDPRGFATYFTHDLAGRLTHTKDPLGGVTYTGYDRASQGVLSLDPLSQPTYFRYDPAGRQSHVTNALFQTTYMGYDLVGNAVQTLLPSEADAIYWTDSTGGAQAIKSCRPDGSGLRTIVSSGLSVPRGIEVDLANGRIYWLDSGNDTIKRASMVDGSGETTLVSTGLSTPRGLRLDVAAGHMYWVDSGNKTIKRANLDGTGVTTLLTATDGLNLPQGLALDLTARKMYWTDAGSFTVNRANMTVGATIEPLVTTGITAPNEIDLDTFSGQMYWIDSGTDTIKRANMADGSGVVTLVSGLTTPRGLRLDLAARVMYFVDPGTNKLQRANLDGSNVTDILTSGITGPEDMALEIPSRVTTQAYDPLNRLLRTTDAYGSQTYMAYDQVGNVERSIDQRGFATYFSYDRLERRTHTKDPVHFASTYMGYDEVGNVVAQVDQQGATTYLTYDRANQVYFTFDRAGARTYFAYDANGNRVSTQVLFGANRRSTYFDYDPASRLLQQTAADGGISYYQLDLAGNRERLVEPAYPGFGFPSYYVYDGLNRLTCRYNQLLEKTYFEYDARSSQTRQIDPVGRATYMAYDALQRLTRQSNALGEFSYFAYDARGNRVATTNPRAFSTYFRFDLLDRQTHRKDALGGVSYVAYDAAGNRVQASDELGQTTYFTLDGLNRLTHSKDQLAAVTYLAYDNRSAVVMRRDADGRATYMVYDTAGRLSRQHYKNPVAGEAATPPSYFVYDEVNALRIVDDRVGGLGINYFDYDAMDRLVKKVTNTGALYYSYDLGGRKQTLKDRSFNENYYLYDGAARLSWEVLDNGNTAYFLYDASGLRTRKRHPGPSGTPLVTYTSYDGAGRVSRIENGTAGFVQADLRYRYLPGGLVAQISYSDNSHSYFDYDALDRLTKEETKDKFSTTTVYGFRYAYDAVGNRTNKSTFGPSTSEAYYTYNALNLVTRERLQPANTDTYYRYDSAQRMLEGRTTDASGQSAYFSHDQLGRVTGIDFASSGGADGARAFSYNGERVTVVDGSTTEWQHDGSKLILERFSGGGPDARNYRHNQGDQGGGSVVQIYSLPDEGPDLMYPGFDERGTVRLVLTTGLVGEYWTDRFGVPLAEKSNFPEVASQRLRFVSPAMVRLGTNNQRFYLTPAGIYIPELAALTVRRALRPFRLGNWQAWFPGGAGPVLRQEGPPEGQAPRDPTPQAGASIPEGFPEVPGLAVLRGGASGYDTVEADDDCPDPEVLTAIAARNGAAQTGDWLNRPQLILDATFDTGDNADKFRWVQYVRGYAEVGTTRIGANQQPLFPTLRVPSEGLSPWTADLADGWNEIAMYRSQRRDDNVALMWDSPGLGAKTNPPAYYTAHYYFASYIACPASRSRAIAYGLCVWSIAQNFNVDGHTGDPSTASAVTCGKIPLLKVDKAVTPQARQTTLQYFKPIRDKVLSLFPEDQRERISQGWRRPPHPEPPKPPRPRRGKKKEDGQ
jgi:YD repeat-containing protein